MVDSHMSTDDSNASEKDKQVEQSNAPNHISGSFPKFALNALEGLIRVIAEGRAIVYVGAGVSQSAGLPSWNELLAKLQAEADGRLKNQQTVATDYFAHHRPNNALHVSGEPGIRFGRVFSDAHDPRLTVAWYPR